MKFLLITCDAEGLWRTTDNDTRLLDLLDATNTRCTKILPGIDSDHFRAALKQEIENCGWVGNEPHGSRAAASGQHRC